jgi:23S rRNA (pseudouridine1915-N3)-methyltransferase
VRIVVLAVGRLRPPFSDDVAHYEKLLSRHARL